MINDFKFINQSVDEQPEKFDSSQLSGIFLKSWDANRIAKEMGLGGDPLPTNTKVKFSAPDGTEYHGRVAARSGSDYVVEISDGESYLVPPGKLEKVSFDKGGVKRALLDKNTAEIIAIDQPLVQMSDRCVVRVAYKNRRPSDSHLISWASTHYPDLRLVDAIDGRKEREIGLIFEITAAEDVKPQGGDSKDRLPALAGEEIDGTGVIAQMGEPGEGEEYNDLIRASRWVLSRFNDSNPDFFAIPQDYDVAGEEPKVVRLGFMVARKGDNDELNHLYINRSGSIVSEGNKTEDMIPVKGYVQVDSQGNLPLVMISGVDGEESAQEFGFNLFANLLIKRRLAQYDACMQAANDVLAVYGGYNELAQSDFDARLTKLAVDDVAKDYWTKYFKEYGKAWVKDVPRKKKAFKKSAVDQAAKEYWTNYFGSYGEMLVRDVEQTINEVTAGEPDDDLEPLIQKTFYGESESKDSEEIEESEESDEFDFNKSARVAVDTRRQRQESLVPGETSLTQGDLDRVIKNIVVQSSNFPELEDLMYSVAYGFLHENPGYVQHLRKKYKQPVQGVLEPEQLTYTLREAVFRSKKYRNIFFKGIKKWQNQEFKRRQKSQYDEWNEQLRDWEQSNRPTKRRRKKKEEEKEPAPPMEEPGEGATFREMEDYVPSLEHPGDQSQEQVQTEQPQEIPLEEEDFEVVEEEAAPQAAPPSPPVEEYDVPVEGLEEEPAEEPAAPEPVPVEKKPKNVKKDKDKAKSIVTPGTKENEEITNLINWVPYPTQDKEGNPIPSNRRKKYPNISFGDIIEQDPAYALWLARNKFGDDQGTADALVQLVKEFGDMSKAKPKSKPRKKQTPEERKQKQKEYRKRKREEERGKTPYKEKVEEPEPEVEESNPIEEIINKKIDKGQFKGMTITEAMSEAEADNSVKRTLFNFLLSPSYSDQFLEFIEATNPQMLDKWKAKVEKKHRELAKGTGSKNDRSVEAMKKRSDAGPGPTSYNAPGKDDKSDYDYKERCEQPSRAQTKFKLNRIYSTTASDDNGYVFMDISWDPESLSGMSNSNIQQSIVSFVKGMESDKYYHDFGIMGKPKIMTADMDAGVARVKVRCSETRGVMTMAYEGDIDDPLPMRGIR